MCWPTAPFSVFHERMVLPARRQMTWNVPGSEIDEADVLPMPGAPMRVMFPLVLAVLPSCRDGVLTTIELDGEATTRIEGATILETLVGDLGFESFISMNLVESDELENQGVESGDIRNARLVGFELEAVSPQDTDLSFIDDMTILVSSPNLAEQPVARADAFPVGAPLVAFDVEDVDLTDYIVSESLTIGTDVAGRRPDQATEVQARYRIEIGVTLQGVRNAR